MARPSTPARLTDEQLKDLLRLSKGSDSVEFKLTVPAEGHRSAIRSLGIDALDAQIRQVFFFDTPELTLYNAGLNLRARRIQGKGEDSVVKLRPIDPEHIEEEQRVSPNMKVEVDAMPGGYVCSASMKGKPVTGATRKVAQGEDPIRRLFSKEQRAFFELHAPIGIEMDALSILGPIFVLKVTFTPEGFDRRMVAEMWLYPDGRRLMELSTKCAPAELMQVATEVRLFLTDHDIDLTSAQETKTRSALQYYAKELKAGAAPAGKGSAGAAGNGTATAPDGIEHEAVQEEVAVEVSAAIDGETMGSADGAADGATGTDADPD